MVTQMRVFTDAESNNAFQIPLSMFFPLMNAMHIRIDAAAPSQPIAIDCSPEELTLRCLEMQSALEQQQGTMHMLYAILVSKLHKLAVEKKPLKYSFAPTQQSLGEIFRS